MTITYQTENPSVFINPNATLRKSDWQTEVERTIDSMIALRKPFSADDLHHLVPANERNFIGHMISELSKGETITRIGDFRSSIPSRKGSRNSIWIATDALVS